MPKNQYLSYEKIKKHAIGKYESGKGEMVEVVCYHNLLYWVCPNPNDKSRSEQIDESYGQGYYVTKETLKIPKSVFDDQENWNS